MPRFLIPAIFYIFVSFLFFSFSFFLFYVNVVHLANRLQGPRTCRGVAHRILDLDLRVHVALRRRSGIGDLQGADEELGDRGVTAGAEEGELQGFFGCGKEFGFHEDSLDAECMVVGYGGKGATGCVGNFLPGLCNGCYGGGR